MPGNATLALVDKPWYRRTLTSVLTAPRYVFHDVQCMILCPLGTVPRADVWASKVDDHPTSYTHRLDELVARDIPVTGGLEWFSAMLQ